MQDTQGMPVALASMDLGIDNATTNHDLVGRVTVWSDGWTSLDLTVIDWHDWAPKGEHDWYEDNAIEWPLIPTPDALVQDVQAFLWERIDR